MGDEKTFFYANKRSMGLWGKVKGVFGRIGRGIKDVASKIWQNRDKIQDAANTFLPDKYKDYVNTGLDYANKVHSVWG